MSSRQADLEMNKRQLDEAKMSLAFEKSCIEVVNVVVKVSKGDEAVVPQHWCNVCGELPHDELHKSQRQR